MKKTNLSWILGLLFVMAMGISSCSDEFNEEEFIAQQADLAESKAAADHQRALEVIQAQLQATLDAIEAQAQADQDNEAARIAAQAEADRALAELQQTLAIELDLIRRSLNSEEDSVAAANYLAAYRAAGLFTEFTVTVNDVDGNPLAGAEVSLSSVADAVTTAADGLATFVDVIAGINTLTVESADILNFRADLRFNRLTVTSLAGGNYIAEPATAQMSLNLFSSSPDVEDLGTVAGTVTIETDLTNDTPEFPVGAVVSADLTNFLNSNNVISFSNGLGASFNLALTEGDMGVGAIDETTGEYSLTVPVASNGSFVGLIFPEIQADQTLAIAQRDGSEIPAEIATVPSRFSLDQAAQAVGSVRSYEVAVSEPATIGEGFAFDYQPIPFRVSDFGATLNSTNNGTTRNFSDDFEDAGRVNIKLESGGSGYTSSPTILAGSDSLGYGYLYIWATSLTVADEGTGYGNEQSVNLSARTYFRSGGTSDRFIKSITSDADGTLPASIELLSSDPFGSQNVTRQFSAIDSVRIIVEATGAATATAADASVTASIASEMIGISLDNTAAIEDKITTFPALTVSGGGSLNQATLSVVTANRYDMTIANPGTGYTIEPSFTLAGTTLGFGGSTDPVELSNLRAVQVDFPSNGFDLNISSALEIDGEGGLQRRNNVFRLESTTDTYFLSEPTVNQDLFTQQLEVNVFIADADEGTLDGFVTTNGANYDENRSVTVTPRIAGVGGSGFEWTFEDSFNASTGEYSLDIVNITNNGSGYTNNLNRGTQNPSFGSSTNHFVRRGTTTTVDKNYGTGIRLEDVGGDN